MAYWFHGILARGADITDDPALLAARGSTRMLEDPFRGSITRFHQDEWEAHRHLVADLADRYPDAILFYLEYTTFGGDAFDVWGRVWKQGRCVSEYYGDDPADDDLSRFVDLMTDFGVNLDNYDGKPRGYFKPFERGFFDNPDT